MFHTVQSVILFNRDVAAQEEEACKANFVFVDEELGVGRLNADSR